MEKQTKVTKHLPSFLDNKPGRVRKSQFKVVCYSVVNQLYYVSHPYKTNTIKSSKTEVMNKLPKNPKHPKFNDVVYETDKQQKILLPH